MNATDHILQEKRRYLPIVPLALDASNTAIDRSAWAPVGGCAAAF